MRVLVTGANGFVGHKVAAALATAGHQARGAVRDTKTQLPDLYSERVCSGEIGPETNWSSALEGMDAVIHLAARVHIMNDLSDDPLRDFRRVNVAGTERLARQAHRAGVRRMIFISSIKVHGEGEDGQYLTEDSPVRPVDPYGVSKLEAEEALHRIAADTGLEVVVIRPVLVYGPGVRANFLSLFRLADMAIPLPLASIDNRRSMVAGANLASLIVHCISDPRAAGENFLAADSDALSTPEWLRRIAAALGRPSRLFPFPPTLLKMGSRCIGKPGLAARLCDSLIADSSKTNRLLGWNQPLSTDEALVRTAQWYRASRTFQ